MTQPLEVTTRQRTTRTRTSRRAALKMGAAITGAVAVGAPAHIINADNDAPQGFTVMADQAANVPLPALRVIARTRLAYGASATNSEGYPNTGDEEADFAAWVAQQLDPAFVSQADDADARAGE